MIWGFLMSFDDVVFDDICCSSICRSMRLKSQNKRKFSKNLEKKIVHCSQTDSLLIISLVSVELSEKFTICSPFSTCLPKNLTFRTKPLTIRTKSIGYSSDANKMLTCLSQFFIYRYVTQMAHNSITKLI